MAKTVIASQEAAQGVAAEADRELIVARTAPEFIEQITIQLTKSHSDLIGSRARARVLQDYSWSANLGKIGRLLDHSDSAWKQREPQRDAHIIHFPARKSA